MECQKSPLGSMGNTGDCGSSGLEPPDTGEGAPDPSSALPLETQATRDKTDNLLSKPSKQSAGIKKYKNKRIKKRKHKKSRKTKRRRKISKRYKRSKRSKRR